MSQSYSTLLHPLKPPTPFKVSIPAQQLTSLKTLLQHTPLPAPTYESLQTDGRLGVSHAWISDAKKCWEEGFDWRASEEWINSFPGFKSRVEIEAEGKSGGKGEFDIHWTGLLSERKDAVPILLLHGWPGLSFVS